VTAKRAGGATPGKPAPAEGTLLADRYRLEEQVAAGGMGEVWRATDQLLERRVAVKLLRESLAEDSVVAERFRREALLAASLSHPNMAGVYDYVEAESRPGIVMEFVEGETLADRLSREERLDVAEVIRIASALLGVLQAAHDGGIVHRDVKPGNVMITPTGGVKVTDFGIARATGAHTLTETGMVLGTAHYLSPEQVIGNPATPASDLYAVGAILYEALAGKKPFEAETPIAVAMRRMNDDPEPLRDHRPDIPEPVEQVVMRAMARDPDERYASADGMRRALESALIASQPPTAPHRVDPQPTMALPLGDVQASGAATTAARARPAQAPVPAKAPAPARPQRRPRPPREPREHPAYRRALALAALIALGLGLVTLLLLWAANGSSTVAVPTFEGRSLAEAQTLAERAGLGLVDERVANAAPAGTVLTQSVDPGTRIAEGQTVRVTVSSGTPPAPPCCTVPNLEGMTKDQAEGALKAERLKLGNVDEVGGGRGREGTVVAQDPKAGDNVEPDTEVNIQIVRQRDGDGDGDG
jgi:serine/threonine-protein kinase